MALDLSWKPGFFLVNTTGLSGVQGWKDIPLPEGLPALHKSGKKSDLLFPAYGAVMIAQLLFNWPEIL